jgi:hypothetical protein
VSESDFPIVKVDTKGVGEGMGKLVELAKSMGVLVFGPAHTVRMAKAEAKALKIRAKTAVEINNLHERAIYRLTKETEREQENIEAFYQYAVKYLPRHVAGEPASPEWAAKFNDRARFASEDEIRTIWAKILASEVAQPGGVSPRTIALVDTMTADDARALESILACAAFAIGEGSELLLVRPTRGSPEEEARALYGVDYATFENLRSAGLISAADDTSIHTDAGREMELTYGGIRIRFASQTGAEIYLPVFLLSKPSREIAIALRVPPNERYLDALSGWAPTIGLSVSSPLP